MPPDLQQCRFLKAARREPVDTTPVWIMRQAGRYLPEYMAVRGRVSFIELCKRPDLAAEVTLVAQQVLGVDAAILFADLLPVLEPMGLELEYLPGEGPVIHNPIRTAADVDRIQSVSDMSELEFVFETARLVRRDLPGDIALIGFGGAPFTLASYAIEGRGSRECVRTRRFMLDEPEAWSRLMSFLSESIAEYLNEQIRNGCQAVQLFDSWAGCLAPIDYERYVLPYSKAVFDRLPKEVPTIHFVTGNPALLSLQRQAGGSVMGIDWRIGLDQAWQTVGYDVALQGNLDPVSLYAELPVLRSRVQTVLHAAGGRHGHIFNLGHGVMPDMDAASVKALVEMVHELGCRPTSERSDP